MRYNIVIFIGDAHGCWDTYRYILNKMQHTGERTGIDCSLQLGDMGIGFSEDGKYSKNGISWSPEVDLNHLFFNGNHDDPALCRSHPNYIGDWGFKEKPSIFFVGGGFSIDYRYRSKDYNWWEDEELSYKEMDSALILYSKKKPRIVATHECPLFLKKNVVTNKDKLGYDSRTEIFLEKMLKIYKPEYWIFGHHHKFFETDIEGTHFVCLNELMYGSVVQCIFEIKDLTWEG